MQDAGQLAIEARVAEQHRHHSHMQFFIVWGVLLVLTAIEVYLGYQNMEPKRMLSILMCLSIVKAALIIAYFMHMKYEASRMKYLTMCSLLFCLAMMMVIFPDAFRILYLGVR
ncbi:MAG: cytochrome C oxidase subunit IV family protein [Terriglobales bacterium]|jgi:cytochrome c oxidase subunit 4